MKNLTVTTKANDVDKKGRVVVAVNGIGIEDSQGDISLPGSFDNTLKNDMARMKWLYNHDYTQLLGVPIEGAEKDGNLVMTGQLNMEKQMCRDVYADYKLMAEYGRTLEHSIGVQAIKRNPSNRKEVVEWKMYEYSTLAFLGSNPQTFLVDIKTATPNEVRKAIEVIQAALKQPEYSDMRLNKFDMNLRLLLKKASGSGRIVRCPCCGELVDYDEQEETTVSQQVMDHARRFTEWVVNDSVYERIRELTPEIQAEVSAILDAIGLSGMKSKSLTDILAYVRCPHCWSRIYSTDIAEAEQPTEKGGDPGKEEKEPKDEETSEETEDESEGKDENDKEEEEEDKKKSFSALLGSIANKIK